MRLRCTALVCLTAVPATLGAQVRASEPAVVAQTIDGTRLTVEYSRPRARGRDSLFGKVVTWGEVWTPGANWATTLEASNDITIEGNPLPRGKYSIWLVVRQGRPWTLVLDPRHRRYHTMHPDSTAEQIRFDVTPLVAPPTEALTWSFSDIRMSGVALVLEWGRMRLPLRIEVRPSLVYTMPPDKAAPFLATWTFTWIGGPEASKPLDMIVTHENGSLMARWVPAPFPEWDRFILIPIGPGRFIPGFLEKGVLYDVERDMMFEFRMDGARPVSYDVRTGDDEKIASGSRKP